jgi:hypothetical protein
MTSTRPTRRRKGRRACHDNRRAADPHAAIVEGVDIDTVASTVRACAGVSDLVDGPFGDVTSYLPGRRVTGVSVNKDRVRVSIRARWSRLVAGLPESDSEPGAVAFRSRCRDAEWHSRAAGQPLRRPASAAGDVLVADFVVGAEAPCAERPSAALDATTPSLTQPDPAGGVRRVMLRWPPRRGSRLSVPQCSPATRGSAPPITPTPSPRPTSPPAKSSTPPPPPAPTAAA